MKYYLFLWWCNLGWANGYWTSIIKNLTSINPTQHTDNKNVRDSRHPIPWMRPKAATATSTTAQMQSQGEESINRLCKCDRNSFKTQTLPIFMKSFSGDSDANTKLEWINCTVHTTVQCKLSSINRIRTKFSSLVQTKTRNKFKKGIGTKLYWNWAYLWHHPLKINPLESIV